MDYPKTVENVNLLDGKFTDGTPSGGTPASLLPSEWLNAITDEVLNILSAAGIDPNEASTTQLGSAIQSMQLNYATDTGAANAYAAAYTPAVTALQPGMVLRFKAVNANTGASTFNVNGLGAFAINGLGGQPLQGGEIAGGSIVKLLYVGASTFTLLSASGGALPVSAGTKSNHAINLGQFVSSFATPGYTKLPNGLILQSGLFTTSSSGITTITYPIAYPTAALCAVAQVASTGSNYSTSIPTANFTKNSFGMYAYSSSNTQAAITGDWFSIGY